MDKKRKGRRLVSKSAHWIEIQERRGGVCAKISLRDIKRAAHIKAQRTSKGLNRISQPGDMRDSDSSWRMRVADHTCPPQQPQVSSTSVSSTGRVRIVGEAGRNTVSVRLSDK